MGILERLTTLAISKESPVLAERNENWAGLIRECEELVGHPYPSPVLGELTAPIKEMDLRTWEHSIKVGKILGALYREFYGFPTFVGEVVGQLHDIGKESVMDLVKKRRKLTPEETEVVHTHVEESARKLEERGFIILARIVKGHHLHGQADSYPDYEETDPFFESLQMTAALADKVVASSEIRPETDEAGIILKINGENDVFRKMFTLFPVDVWPQIEYLRENLYVGEELLPATHRLPGAMAQRAFISDEFDKSNIHRMDNKPNIVVLALIVFRQWKYDKYEKY